jgi:hypothetical protein
MKIDFYDVDPQMYSHLMAIIIEKTKLQKPKRTMSDSSSNQSSVDLYKRQELMDLGGSPLIQLNGATQT